ncbi:MAG TPA: cupin domain-containing protein [Candidatus Limnocylindrales bacterium]|nr:cupin domain-containing protein [Candidatus Limnocylindrales bacterium]
MADFPLVVRAAAARKVSMSGDRGESLRLIDEASGVEALNARFNRLDADGPGQRHHHPGSDLLCYVVFGELEIETPDGVALLGPGDLELIPAGMDHAIRKAAGPSVGFLEVYVPGPPEFIYT